MNLNVTKKIEMEIVQLLLVRCYLFLNILVVNLYIQTEISLQRKRLIV